MRPLNGCLPRTAKTLVKGEGGSEAAAETWTGVLDRDSVKNCGMYKRGWALQLRQTVFKYILVIYSYMLCYMHNFRIVYLAFF